MSYTFAIGDIHGCHESLENLLSTIEYGWKGGTVVFLGDYVDRGPSSRAVVERIMAGPASTGWRWIALKGNHEDLMVQASTSHGERSAWVLNGGYSTLLSFGGEIPAHVIDWAGALPLYHQDCHRLFVHSGVVDERRPLDEQESRVLLWRRPLPDESGTYWGRHLVHGHTPSESPQTIGNRTNIDTGCVFGGALTAAVFDDDQPGAPIGMVQFPGPRAT